MTFRDALIEKVKGDPRLLKWRVVSCAEYDGSSGVSVIYLELIGPWKNGDSPRQSIVIEGSGSNDLLFQLNWNKDTQVDSLIGGFPYLVVTDERRECPKK